MSVRNMSVLNAPKLKLAMKATLAMAAALGVASVLVASTVPAAAAARPALTSIAGGETAVTEVRYRRGGGGYYGGYYGGYGYYRPPVYLYAAPPVVYQTYSGGGHCAWLRNKARATGSRYWWNRYRNEC